MVQVDLITGFLGAGKTTFLRRYVRYLVEQGHNVCILENDFGAVNVDAMLVQDLLGPRCDLETISGGCDCDTVSFLWTEETDASGEEIRAVLAQSQQPQDPACARLR